VATPAPLDDAERDRIRAMHAAGRSRNDIARELGRSASTISKAAGRLGLRFDRAKTTAATAAKVADAKARRAALALALLGDAERLRTQLFAPAELHSFGGAEHTYRRVEIERPPAKDQREIMQATNTAIGASLRLDVHDGDANVEKVGSLLGALFDNMRDKHGEDGQDAAGADG
jgi:hypothetical protein